MTEELQKYAERLAEKWVERNCVTHVPGEHPQITAAVLKTNREIYGAGFRAAQEVFELRGRIAALREATNDSEDDGRYSENEIENMWAIVHKLEARLASLLEGEARDE